MPRTSSKEVRVSFLTAVCARPSVFGPKSKTAVCGHKIKLLFGANGQTMSSGDGSK